MLYISKYLLRQKEKHIPLFLIILILVGLITYFSNFANIFRVQREQYFTEQVKQFNVIIFETSSIKQQINKVVDKLGEEIMVQCNIHYVSDHMLFGLEMAPLYVMVKEDYEQLSEIMPLLPQNSIKPSLVISNSLKKSQGFLPSQMFSFQDEEMPIFEFQSTGKYGFIVTEEVQPQAILVFKLFTSEERLALLKKFPFIKKILNHEVYYNNLDKDLSFINTTIGICIFTIFIIAQLLVGISTYFNVRRRTGEISIYNILGFGKGKVAFKLVTEYFLISFFGMGGGIIFSYIMWHYTMEPLLNNIGTTVIFEIPQLLAVFPFGVLMVVVLITVKITRSINPIGIILQEAENSVL